MNTHLLRSEFRLYFRDIAAIIFGLLLSPLILIILGAIPSFREAKPELGGQSVIALYVPTMIIMAIAMVAISTMPVQLALYRERGILRRLSTTPVRPKDLLLAQAAVQFAVLLMGSLAVLLLGWVAFGVALPGNPAAFALIYILCVAAMFGIGLMLASVSGSKTAQGIGSAVFFPLMFFAGLWVPVKVMPEALRTISSFTPLGAGVQALQDSAIGQWPQLLHIGVLLVWTALAWIGAIRMFRWS
ncbi:transport permease protein [Rhizocola hellebori]|uniref:Transport permease protein n=1 Tax=Rhizocola hellebori TaxID=1392758 RepID=A0A8J3QHD4_9ACTN|nr:ABC transporter permease [Rhizocola hellebori]GIH10651.1 transport permease protein [Rhizocola hellebori]